MTAPPPSRTSRTTVRAAGPDDLPAVLALVRAAFGAEDPAEGATVAALVADLHAEAEHLRTVPLVAEEGGVVVGYVALSRGWVDDPRRLVEVAVLSPLAVRPDRQGEGLGTALLAAAAHAAEERGYPLVLLEGDPGLYARRGYVAVDTLGLERPSDRIPRPACQVLTLGAYDEELSGRLVYPDVFWRHDAVGLRGEVLTAVERALAGSAGTSGGAEAGDGLTEVEDDESDRSTDEEE